MARQLGSIVRQTRAFVNRRNDKRQKTNAACVHLGDQEDHISNSMNAARHAWQILRNVERVVGIELVTAAQALGFRVKADPRAQLGAGTAYPRIRQDISHLERDRLMYPDLDRGAELVRSGEALRAVEEALGRPLE
jgi:histidine ammonia-lyase